MEPIPLASASVRASASPEAAILDLYASGESATWAQGAADIGSFERMRLASQTAQFGQLVWSKRYFDHEATRTKYREIIQNIKNGDFAKEWHTEKQAGAPRLKSAWKDNRTHPMIVDEDRLYQTLGRRSGKDS